VSRGSRTAGVSPCLAASTLGAPHVAAAAAPKSKGRGEGRGVSATMVQTDVESSLRAGVVQSAPLQRAGGRKPSIIVAPGAVQPVCEAWPGGHIRTRTLLLVDERCFFFCRRDEPIAGASCVGTVARRHPFGTPHIPFLAFLQHTRGYAHVAPATAVTESTGESERAARRGGFLEDVPGDA